MPHSWDQKDPHRSRAVAPSVYKITSHLGLNDLQNNLTVIIISYNAIVSICARFPSYMFKKKKNTF